MGHHTTKNYQPQNSAAITRSIVGRDAAQAARRAAGLYLDVLEATYAKGIELIYPTDLVTNAETKKELARFSPDLGTKFAAVDALLARKPVAEGLLVREFNRQFTDRAAQYRKGVLECHA